MLDPKSAADDLGPDRGDELLAEAAAAPAEGRNLDCIRLLDETAPGDAPPQRTRLRIEATAAENAGLPQRAVATWDALAALDALAPEDRVTVARARIKAGAVARGFAEFAALLRDPGAGFRAATVAAPLHEKLRNYAAALEVWQQAYKFHPGFVAKFDRILKERQHAMASQQYTHYKTLTERLDERLPDDDSLVFAGSDTLVGAGICNAPAAWQNFA
ncbi:hypothetical protein [Methylobrevis albus]|uniref:Uncharacterized protein n=1 Tax=Methylobrevis albus TaxID=2793297 RepID=A0A931I3S1_9HYPH|nr:hypothetical protein [Methylobrevis albus]MBH0238909.1 hypothetical protein [Methylobrevis albus]